MSQEYDIRESVKSLGKLVPVLKDKFGNVIDGLHRLEMFPDWPCVTVDSIDTNEKLEAARLAVNMNRRVVLKSEIDLRVLLLAKSGLKAEEIAAMSGLAKSTVYKHYPQELKNPDRVAAGTVGGSALRVEQKVPETKVNTQKHECNYCHITNGEAREWNGHYLCQRDFAKALDDPAKFHRYFDLLDKGRQVMRDKENSSTKPQTPMGLTKYADRVEMRKVQHSGIENKIVNRLRAKGFNVVTDQKIVVYEVWTDPDFNIQLSNGKVVHGYVDHVDTHKARQIGRDEELRDLLKKREPGCLIVPVWVKGDSDGEADEKVAEIEQELKF